ncbi:MAG: phospho-N-acetylmuramoyl-pentapeptide-transferase [bacterium]|nr:MAG: phospho-N-acetylmuramoyl-pentapeptide-transferase [bacterium]
MLYKLFINMRSIDPGFNVFRYITFRTALSVLTALGVSFILGPWIIGRLKTVQPGNYVREYLPEGHVLKAGVPTMGGLLIFLAIVFSTLLWSDLSNRMVWVVLVTFAGFGLLGLADDMLKLYGRKGKGLAIRGKFLAQLLLATGVAVYLYIRPSGEWGHFLQLPFFKEILLDLGWVYIPFVILVIIGTSNGVNLTDGLDGLAIGPVMFASGAFALLIYLSGHAKFADYLQIFFVPEAGELAVFAGAMVGASLGFLWFNTYPAQVFMGDIGSLSLGGSLGALAVISKHEILLVFAGGLFVLETLSVIIQVISFRCFGKRVFLMAPLHHHFEKKGWPEPKIIVRFWIISIILVLVSLSTLKVR